MQREACVIAMRGNAGRRISRQVCFPCRPLRCHRDHRLRRAPPDRPPQTPIYSPLPYRGGTACYQMHALTPAATSLQAPFNKHRRLIRLRLSRPKKLSHGALCPKGRLRACGGCRAVSCCTSRQGLPANPAGDRWCRSTLDLSKSASRMHVCAATLPISRAAPPAAQHADHIGQLAGRTTLRVHRHRALSIAG
ncbi:hypothetical protein XBLMG947_1369 [Xanthomonas bromi]|uniref:Uncharacterized protein n=1 Tax=Xanthomonas bromi TaxID=56449 RepID=A0A1C3NJK5_9XANT|nr:hypothetical protein XBLMG947_1369 [Xanthomonas bromi]